MPLKIVHKDITDISADAIVNAANSTLHPGGGVSHAIFKKAGPDLSKACKEIGFVNTGCAVITKGYRTKARYIIHAVGPVWEGGAAHEEELLSQTYVSALELALEHDVRSIAFPLISSGAYGYPPQAAL
ncbi:MAG: macro domain-containing protein, partial [Abditibacteriota bacterium]|nr:macro domain-containing protein [Abditibacteriota bacterium]